MSREPESSLKNERKSRRRRSKEQMCRLVEDYRSSGLTQVAFAESRKVPLSTLTGCLRRMRVTNDGDAVSDPAEPGFVEAQLLGSERAFSETLGHDFELLLSNHAGGRSVSSVRLRQGFSAQELRRLLRCLGVFEKQP